MAPAQSLFTSDLLSEISEFFWDGPWSFSSPGIYIFSFYNLKLLPLCVSLSIIRWCLLPPKSGDFLSRSCYSSVIPLFFSFCFQLESLTNHVQNWRELSEKFNKRLVSSEEEMTHRVSLLFSVYSQWCNYCRQ